MMIIVRSIHLRTSILKPVHAPVALTPKASLMLLIIVAQFEGYHPHLLDKVGVDYHRPIKLQNSK